MATAGREFFTVKAVSEALAEFRQRYPEYRISEQMLKKVERPK